MGSRVRWLLALLVVVSGCGGGDTEDGPAASDVAASDTNPAVAAEALVERWGSDRDAFYVVMWSLDGGYSATQIIDAAPAGRIRADGTIVDDAGAVVGAEREPEGLLIRVAGEATGGGIVMAAALPVAALLAAEEPQDAEVTAVGMLSEVFEGGLAAWQEKQALLRAQAEATSADFGVDDTAGITWLTLGLGARGYSAEQILEALLLGNWEVFRSDSLNYCWRVFSSKGDEILPAYETSDLLLELECAEEAEQREAEEAEETEAAGEAEDSSEEPGEEAAEPADDPAEEPGDGDAAAPLAFPRTYVGGGPTTWSMSWWSAGNCVVEGDKLELTLKADGTLSGTYRGTARSFQRKTEQDPWTCGEEIFPQDPVEVTGRHTPPGPGTDIGDVFVEIVRWPDWNIQGKYTQSDMTFVSEIQYEATGYEGDAPNPRVIRVVDYTLLFSAEG